jgi:hypothetical protein
MLMADKKIVYNGDAKSSIEFIGKLGELYKVPEHTNPSEHYLNLITIDYKLVDHETGEKLKFDKRKEALLDAYRGAKMDRCELDDEMSYPTGKPKG